MLRTGSVPQVTQMAVRSFLLAIPMLMAGACFADEGTPATPRAKPECSAETEHLMWPEKSERRSGGPVEICVEKHLKYRWQPLTVDISELRAKAKGTAGNQAASTSRETPAGKARTKPMPAE